MKEPNQALAAIRVGALVRPSRSTRPGVKGKFDVRLKALNEPDLESLWPDISDI